jgi:Na+/proline symporter
LVIAAIFAAAMSNLSGSLNSLSSSTVLDLYRPLFRPDASDEHLLKLSRWLTAAWGVVLIGIAVLASSWGSVFTTGLTIASLVYGPMLGAFLLGVLTRRANQTGVMVGMAVTLLVMIFIKFNGPALQWVAAQMHSQPGAWMEWLSVRTNIAWTWYVLIGTIICCAVGYLISLLTPAPAPQPAVKI